MTGIDAILGTFTTLGSLLTKVFDLMTANPYLILFFGAALLGIGISIFKMLKGAAKR